jgi:hypothetical protein
MWMFLNPNQVKKLLTRLICVSKWLLSDKVTPLLVTKYTNKIYVSDVICIIETAVSAQYESVWTTPVMPHSSMYPTAKLSTQTSCTWLRYFKLRMVRHGNRGEGAGYGMVRKSNYIYQKLVSCYTCRQLPAESAGMWLGHIISQSDSVDSHWSEIER